MQGLVAATHFPAERRTLQIQNVDSALLELEDLGVAFDASAEDLVGGVRDKTLGFLWSLIAGLQVTNCWFGFDNNPIWVRQAFKSCLFI